MSDATLPTAEGIKRYPPKSFYIANRPDGPPCTCQPDCQPDCRGKCGCKACSEAWHDFGYDD